MSQTYLGEFLTYLAVKRNVAASTQNQAMNALVYHVIPFDLHVRHLPIHLP